MKLIVNCENPDHWVCAIRAAKWLLDQPLTQRNAILVYGDDTAIYVTRNKASITARDCSDSSGERAK
jgi:S-methylmethionine-dependent homocysteine/selenocysteine methylase